jgi:signal transduction histidine kinase
MTGCQSAGDRQAARILILMDAEFDPGAPPGEPFDTLYAEAKSALAFASDRLRLIADRYREAFHEELGRWHESSGAFDDAERLRLAERLAVFTAPPGAASSASASDGAAIESGDASGGPAVGALAGGPLDRSAADLAALQVPEEESAALDGLQAELSRLELVARGLESAWLFLERGDAGAASSAAMPDLPGDVGVRIVEAQEAERSRLAQEVHDGPAQALSNAILQVEYIDRVLDEDPRVVHAELRVLRDRLRRELGDVRAFISQLRPPLLDELGLDGSIEDAAESLAALTGAQVETSLLAPAERLGDAEQTVVLRVLQESLQNVRKHAGAGHAWVSTRLEDGRWLLEVRDDGHGFDMAALGPASRRNFGLQFMRERADLVRARLSVRSRPGEGTVVTLEIPIGEEGGSG